MPKGYGQCNGFRYDNEQPIYTPPKQKRCKTCGSIKRLNEFERDEYSPDGRSETCKECLSLKRGHITSGGI